MLWRRNWIWSKCESETLGLHKREGDLARIKLVPKINPALYKLFLSFHSCDNGSIHSFPETFLSEIIYQKSSTCPEMCFCHLPDHYSRIFKEERWQKVRKKLQSSLRVLACAFAAGGRCPQVSHNILPRII